jgi:hypothetical protein
MYDSFVIQIIVIWHYFCVCSKSCYVVGVEMFQLVNSCHFQAGILKGKVGH